MTKLAGKELYISQKAVGLTLLTIWIMQEVFGRRCFVRPKDFQRDPGVFLQL
jgi:hypothetical protein